MQFGSQPKRWIAGLGGLALVLFVAALLMRTTDPGRTGKETSRLTSGGSTNKSVPQKLPSGIERSLTVEIPLLGHITGARWIAGHQFRLMPETHPNPERFPELAMDVLVDQEGNFIAARRNGERFDTRPPEASFKDFLRPVAGVYYREPDGATPNRPLSVAGAARAKIRWDDPRLGNAIKKLAEGGYFDGYSPGIENRIEETYTVIGVQYEEEAQPRLVVVRRATEGLVSDMALATASPPPPVGNSTAYSNRYGAHVQTSAALLEEASQQLPNIIRMHLVEPWQGACPWPLERLDPMYGDYRLDEHRIPSEYHVGDANPLSPESFRNGLTGRLTQEGEARRTARLEKEGAR
jgi:hypothetical protein